MRSKPWKKAPLNVGFNGNISPISTYFFPIIDQKQQKSSIFKAYGIKKGPIKATNKIIMN